MKTDINKLIIAPITFVSFLISLAVVDTRNSSLRTHYHSQAHPAPSTTLYGRLTHKLHTLIWREQPYAYVKSPNARHGEDKKGAAEEPWHWNTKQKQMMRMEVSDAFEMRKTVVVVMIAIVLGLGLLGSWAAKYVFGLLLQR